MPSIHHTVKADLSEDRGVFVSDRTEHRWRAGATGALWFPVGAIRQGRVASSRRHKREARFTRSHTTTHTHHPRLASRGHIQPDNGVTGSIRTQPRRCHSPTAMEQERASDKLMQAFQGISPPLHPLKTS